MKEGENDNFATPNEAIALFMKLTPREKALLELLVKGYSNRQVAGLLHISIRTVEFHKSKLKEKTNATDLKDLIGFVNTIRSLHYADPF